MVNRWWYVLGSMVLSGAAGATGATGCQNGDVCTRTKLKGFPQFWLCSYTGGKGCD
jgi:hypothetical protein